MCSFSFIFSFGGIYTSRYIKNIYIGKNGDLNDKKWLFVEKKMLNHKHTLGVFVKKKKKREKEKKK